MPERRGGGGGGERWLPSCALASRNFVYWVAEKLGGCEGKGRKSGGRALMTTKRVTTTAHYWAATISSFSVIFSTYFVFLFLSERRKRRWRRIRRKRLSSLSNSLKEGPYFNQALHFFYPFHFFVFVVCLCCIGVARTLQGLLVRWLFLFRCRNILSSN